MVSDLVYALYNVVDPSVLFSAFHLTAGSDYTPGPYTVTFTPGQSSATFMVSTEEDDTVELSEYFTLMIATVDRPDVVEIGSPSTSVITILDNEPGSMDATFVFPLHALIIDLCIHIQNMIL